MNKQEHFDYVLYSIIWNATLSSLKPRKYSYSKKVEIIGARETPCFRASKDATRILIMPRPTMVEDLSSPSVSNAASWAAASTSTSYSKHPYTDIYPRRPNNNEYANFPILDGLSVQDITYDDKYEDETDIKRKIAKLIEEDWEIQGFIKEIDKIKTDQQKLAQNPDMGAWLQIRMPKEKLVDHSSKIRQLESKISRRREKLAEKLFKGYIREQRGMFARFADEWHLNYHIERACDFYFEQTGIEEFAVVVQRWAPRRGEMEIYACYFIIDTLSDSFAPTDFDLE
jgi:hypothetical protein